VLVVLVSRLFHTRFQIGWIQWTPLKSSSA
jgi:hypothetical protein